MESLQSLALSLQNTSRVLSAKGLMEQASIQEAVVQLLGLAILDEIEPRLVDEALEAMPSDTKAFNSQHVVGVLNALGAAMWVGQQSGLTVLATAVEGEEDWQGLPVFLQNHVARKHFACHLLVFIEQLSLPGDTQHRHYAEPVFVILHRHGLSGLESHVALGAPAGNADPAVAVPEALAHVDPFMRIVFKGLMKIEMEAVQ